MNSFTAKHYISHIFYLFAFMAFSFSVFSAELEEIVVTAEFREADVQDTPVAITAINGEMMEARGQTGLAQIAAQAPNVTLNPAPADSGPAMLAFIRGVGQTDFNYAVEPGVGIYVDDVYFPTLTGTLMDLIDLDRIEILRGPQGTLSGRNSIGGSIKLFSKKAGEGDGHITATYGSYNRIDVKGSADFTIVEDTLYGRISGLTKHRDGYMDRIDYGCENPGSGVPTFITGGLTDCKLGTLGGISTSTGRASLRWAVNNRLEITVTGDMTNDDSEAAATTLLHVNDPRNNPNLPNPGFGVNGPIGPGGGEGTFYDVDGDYTTTADRVYFSSAFIPNDPYKSYATFIDPNARTTNNIAEFSPSAMPPVRTLDDFGISGVIDFDINDDFSLKSISSYRKYDSTWAQDMDGSPINSQQLLQELEHDQFSQELRLNGTVLNGMLDFTVGGFYFKQDGTLEANVNLFYALLNFVHGPDPTPSDSKAAFGHFVFHVNDRLNLTGGLRYTSDTKDYVFHRRNPDGTEPKACLIPGPPQIIGQFSNCAVAGLSGLSKTFEDTRLDYRVAVDYAFTDNIMAYTQFSTGYKGGGVNPRPFFPVQIETFNPETVNAYEVGFKTTLFDRRVRLNGALFYNDYADIQLQQTQCELPYPPFFGAPCLQPGNAGSADVYGFELETEIYPTESFFIDASVSYLNFEYKEVSPNVAVTLDMITPYTPEWKWSVGGQYDWAIGMGTVSARIDASYQSDTYGNSTNSPFNLIDGYTLVNARLSWNSSDEVWGAAFEVSNLTDELYYLNIFDQYFSSGMVSGTPSLPRMYAFSITRRF